MKIMKSFIESKQNAKSFLNESDAVYSGPFKQDVLEPFQVEEIKKIFRVLACAPHSLSQCTLIVGGFITVEWGFSVAKDNLTIYKSQSQLGPMFNMLEVDTLKRVYRMRMIKNTF